METSTGAPKRLFKFPVWTLEKFKVVLMSTPRFWYDLLGTEDCRVVYLRFPKGTVFWAIARDWSRHAFVQVDHFSYKKPWDYHLITHVARCSGMEEEIFSGFRDLEYLAVNHLFINLIEPAMDTDLMTDPWVFLDF